VLTGNAFNRSFTATWWSIPGLFVIAVVFALAIFGPRIGELEGQVFPVTGKVTISDVRVSDDGTRFRMGFSKNRNCELIGITVKIRGVAVPAGPAPGEVGSNGTLATGERRSQVWLVPGSTLDDMEISWSHRCSLFWVTITHAYP
jgi:hypothetical protein